MHAGRGHRPGRRLLRIGTPIIGGHCEPGRRCLRALAVSDDAETPVRDARLQLDHRGMKPSRIGEGQHHPGPRDGVERRLGALHVERERLFHEDVLAGRGSPFDLCAMLAVRRREHDRIDGGVGEDLVEIVLQRDAVLGAERLGRGAGAGAPSREAERAALSLYGIDQRSAPAAEADNGGADHFLAASVSRTPRSAR